MDISYNAGLFKQQFKYKSFSPSFINKQFTWQDSTINVLLEDAGRLLGELNAYSFLVPDIDYFIKMHVAKEATTSSRIEGTKTGIDEAILPKEEIDPERRDDWSEVNNYIKAINYAVQKLGQLPLSLRLLKKTHKILLSGVRGMNKDPGEIRQSQNWIGGKNLETAFFIPPHPDELAELLSDMEKFWHNDDLQIPHLIKIALTHYQFETIHPFLDGNGRTGRLLITLQLIHKGLLTKPTLYLSDFFEKNKGAYYDSLTVVRASNNIEQWIKFFFTGIITTCNNGIHTFKEIIQLQKDYEHRIFSLGTRAKRAKQVLYFFFSQPRATVKQLSQELKMPFNTMNRLVTELEKMEILTESTNYARNRIFELKKYMDLFR